jgi:nitroreductase
MRRRELLAAAGSSAFAFPSMALAAEPSAQESAARCGSLEKLLGKRRMVRRYRDEPVPPEVVERLIATATRAPSAGHTQPWAFVVVRDAERRRALARAALEQMFVAEAPVVIVACAELERSRRTYGARGDQYALIDTAFASLLLLLAVVEEGLGACFVGAFEDAEVARILGLPGDVKPVAVISIGRPAEQPGRMRLRPRRESVHDERWS